MKINPTVGRKVVAEAIREFAQGPEQANLQQFARHLCRNSEEAKELVQETYYRALKFGAYEPRGLLAAWLRRVLKNVFVDSRRRKACRDVSLHLPAPDGDALLAEILSDGSWPLGEAMEREEVRQTVRGALASLSAHHRRVLELCDLEGVAYEEAARRLGILVGTVRSRLARARAKLRRILSAY